MARIIVVEDDPAQQELLLAYLNYTGHEAKGALDGKELDACLQNFVPDIVLLDYVLPGENGALLASRLRARFGWSLGIIMVTVYRRSTDRIECRQAGADEYLVKPINLEEMKTVIENLLRRLDSGTVSAQAWKLIPARFGLQPPRGPFISLGESEVRLLSTLARDAQHKASRENLIRALGKNPLAYDQRALETSISRLRRKLPRLDDGHNPLQAIRGFGYHFIHPLAVVDA